MALYCTQQISLSFILMDIWYLPDTISRTVSTLCLLYVNFNISLVWGLSFELFTHVQCHSFSQWDTEMYVIDRRSLSSLLLFFFPDPSFYIRFLKWDMKTVDKEKQDFTAYFWAWIINMSYLKGENAGWKIKLCNRISTSKKMHSVWEEKVSCGRCLITVL